MEQKLSRDYVGSDGAGKTFHSTQELWQSQLQGDVDDPNSGWYGKAISYWAKVPPTVNGVLGGMEHVHEWDIAESKAFILSLFPSPPRERALDCGAGIGRISKCLLCPLFNVVDLLEPLEHMVAQAQKELPAGKVGHVYVTSMQKVQLEEVYDLIVIQWTAIYLTDADFVAFLKLCKAHLRPNTGHIFFKENVASSEAFLLDSEDSSITRCDGHYKAIFEQAGVQLVREIFQQRWDPHLFPVKMYALK